MARSISVGVDAGQGMMDGAPEKSEESSKRGEDREIFRGAQLAGALRSTTDGKREPLLCGARRHRRGGGA